MRYLILCLFLSGCNVTQLENSKSVDDMGYMKDMSGNCYMLKYVNGTLSTIEYISCEIAGL